MRLTADIQFEMTAIVNRLVKTDTKFFDPDDAIRLAEIVVSVGISTGTSMVITVGGMSKGGMQGNAAGVGNVRLEDEEAKPFKLGRDEEVIAAGKWEIGALVKEGKNQFITIQKRFDETRSPDDRDGYKLRFSDDGKPINFNKMVWKVYRLSLFGHGLSFAAMGLEPIKTPSPNMNSELSALNHG